MAEDVRIELPRGGTLRAHLALPAHSDAPAPALVVVHEIWGLNDDMRRIAARFAEHGYAVVAPDLYSHGAKPLCVTRVLFEAQTLREGQAVADIEVARSFLASQPSVDPDRCVVVGFCMGGGFALLAASGGRYRAAGTNYGFAPSEQQLHGICPVVGSFGALDTRFTAQGRQLVERLERLGVEHDIKVYEGVGHSFLSEGGAPSWAARLPNPLHVAHDPEAAEDAWRRMLSFFDAHVR